MTEEPKKVTRKRAAPKATPAAKAPARKKTARKAPVLIRNLRAMQVHVRMENPLREKPFRVSLKPRGQMGDVEVIPVELQSSREYLQGLGILFEIITKKEAAEIEYPLVGYQARQEVQIIHENDNVIATESNWDGKKGTRPPERLLGRQNPEAFAAHPRRGESVGPVYTDVAGSDRGLHETLRADDSAPKQEGALPPGTNFNRPERTIMTRQKS